jgi:hypothetical protein
MLDFSQGTLDYGAISCNNGHMRAIFATSKAATRRTAEDHLLLPILGNAVGLAFFGGLFLAWWLLLDSYI